MRRSQATRCGAGSRRPDLFGRASRPSSTTSLSEHSARLADLSTADWVLPLNARGRLLTIKVEGTEHRLVGHREEERFLLRKQCTQYFRQFLAVDRPPDSVPSSRFGEVGWGLYWQNVVENACLRRW